MGIFDIIKSTKAQDIKIGGWMVDPPNKIYSRFDRSSLVLAHSNNIQYKSGENVDLRPYSSARHYQGSTSSCIANALVKALEIKRIIKNGHAAHVDLSRLFLYYYTRALMTPPMTNTDAGSYISFACDVLRTKGVCREDLHPFRAADVNKAPSQMAAREARLNMIKSHFKIKSQGNERLDDIIFNLKAGNPVIFGTKVGADWRAYKGGKEPLRVETRPEGGHALCCHPNTVVRTINGNKFISDIDPGDIVLTSEGWKEVNAKTERYTNENLYQIKSQLSLEPLQITGEHPVLVLPTNNWSKFKKVNLNNFEFMEAKDIKQGYYVKSIIDNSIEENDISHDFARLLGYYVGDGNLAIQKNKKGTRVKSIKFRLTYHRRDKKEIIDDLINIIEKEYPETKHSIYEVKNENTNIITFYNTKLGRRILNLCGKAKNKTISKLLKIEPDKQMELLKGWFKTDGCGKWLQSSQIFTAEKNLAEDLLIILQRNKLHYSTTVRSPKKNLIKGRLCNCKGGYSIRFNDINSKIKMQYVDNNIYTKIKTIKTIPYQGFVYNLEVNDCHEFLANNIITHNCIVGFVSGLFIIENSWRNWGEDGFGYVSPEAIAHPSARDFWVIIDGSEAWTEAK